MSEILNANDQRRYRTARRLERDRRSLDERIDDAKRLEDRLQLQSWRFISATGLRVR